jgi:hypothetical protein
MIGQSSTGVKTSILTFRIFVDLTRSTQGQDSINCLRKPTARLALTSTERRDKEPFMPFSTAFRPLRPLEPWLFHQAQTEIDTSPNPAI